LQLLQEPQRRNVFRVAIGYVVSSWLLFQVADLVLENIGAPDWVMQTIMQLLALGFPVVVFFSWACEVTPDDRVPG
jgi:adenylate cyclase